MTDNDGNISQNFLNICKNHTIFKNNLPSFTDSSFDWLKVNNLLHFSSWRTSSLFASLISDMF